MSLECVAASFNSEFNLAEAFSENLPKIRIGKWSISNIDTLEYFWGKIKYTTLWINMSDLSLLGYERFCSCPRITQFVATWSEWEEMVGPHICAECQQIVVMQTEKKDRIWLQRLPNSLPSIEILCECDK